MVLFLAEPEAADVSDETEEQDVSRGNVVFYILMILISSNT